MQLKLIIVSIWFLYGCQIQRHDYEPLKGPYLQNQQKNSITIMWESDSAEKGTVRFGETTRVENSVSEKDTARIHEIILSGLNPETKYYYQIVSGDKTSPVFQFETAVEKTSPFSFIAFGDSRNNPTVLKKNAELILKKSPDIVLHNGDFVERGGVYRQWAEYFFNPMRELMRAIPVFGVIGNHEDNHPNYFNFFSMPGNERYYSFDYGNAHFTIIDSDDELLFEDSEQVEWLKLDLAESDAEWKFVLMHHPLFTAGGYYYSDSRIKRKNLLHPIFEQNQVDLVICGDDHDYERTFPIKTRGGQTAVSYVVAGNGGVPMRYVGKREWTLATKRVYGFVKIDINGPSLKYSAIDIDDNIIDSFELDKNEAQSVADYIKDTVTFEMIKDPVMAAKYYSKGKKAHKNDQYEEAIQWLQKAFSADNTCAEAQGRMAECYIKLGQLDKANEAAELCIKINPEYPDGYGVLADVLTKEKKFDRAMQWLDKMNHIAPDSPEAIVKMAGVFAETGDLKQAILMVRNAIDLFPVDYKLYFNLGEFYEESGNYEAALEAYKTGIYWYMEPEIENDYREVTNRIKILEQGS